MTKHVTRTCFDSNEISNIHVIDESTNLSLDIPINEISAAFSKQRTPYVAALDHGTFRRLGDTKRYTVKA